MDGSARPGLITPIGWTYVVLGTLLTIAVLMHAKIGPAQLAPIHLTSTVPLAIAGAAAVLRLRWGRWLAYAMSVLLLPGVPIGTILGALMIYHLTIHREQFNAQRSARIVGS